MFYRVCRLLTTNRLDKEPRATGRGLRRPAVIATPKCISMNQVLLYLLPVPSVNYYRGCVRQH